MTQPSVNPGADHARRIAFSLRRRLRHVGARLRLPVVRVALAVVDFGLRVHPHLAGRRRRVERLDAAMMAAGAAPGLPAVGGPSLRVAVTGACACALTHPTIQADVAQAIKDRRMVFSRFGLDSSRDGANRNASGCALG